MIKNKSTLGLSSFLQEFYEDLQSGQASGWWNERYSRKGELLNVPLKDGILKDVYSLIEYIKENYADVTQEELDSVKDYVSNIYMVLNYKRVYLWEVNTEKVESVQDVVEDTSNDEPVQEDATKEAPKEVSPEPDWELAKSFSTKKKLQEYAKTFGFKLDGRKDLEIMVKSFQGKYYAKRSKS